MIYLRFKFNLSAVHTRPCRSRQYLLCLGAAHLADRSSADYPNHLCSRSGSQHQLLGYLIAQLVSGLARSLTRPSTPLAIAQTTVPAHWLPFPHAASHRVRQARDKTFLLPRDAPVAVLGTHL